MFCSTSETEGEVDAKTCLCSPPSNSLLISPSQWLWCGSLLPVFGDRDSVTFYLMGVIILFFMSVWAVEWPSFGKALLTRLTICSLCIFTVFNFSYFPVLF